MSSSAVSRPARLRSFIGQRGPFSSWLGIGLILLVGTLVRLSQLSHGLNELYGFRQTQTAFTVREFAERGIDLSTSPLPVFGAPWTVPMEFPLFQALAAPLVHAGLGSDFATRLLALIFFQLTAVLLAILLLRWTSRLTTVVAIIFFEFTPFGVQWGAAALIEFFATFLILGMIIGLDLWFRRRSIVGLVIAAVAGPLAFTVKITTAIPWCVVLIGLAIALIRERGWAASWLRILVGYAVGPALGLGAGIAWTRYSDVVKSANPFADILTSARLTEWNFGTIAERFSSTVFVIPLRISETIVGFVGVALLASVVVIILTKRSRAELLSLLAVPIVAAAIFTNLYIQHDYYLSAVFPALVALAAVGVVGVVTRFAKNRKRIVISLIVTAVLLATMWVTPLGQKYAGLFANSLPAPTASTELLENTPHGSEIIMVGCSWDPTILYYADRRGLTLQGEAEPASPIPAGYDLSGYDYVYVCSPNAVLNNYLPPGIKTELVAPDLYKIEK